MSDDVSMLLLVAARRGDKDMIEYLLSSYRDMININIQDKVSILLLIEYDRVCYILILCYLIGWL